MNFFLTYFPMAVIFGRGQRGLSLQVVSFTADIRAPDLSVLMTAAALISPKVCIIFADMLSPLPCEFCFSTPKPSWSTFSKSRQKGNGNSQVFSSTIEITGNKWIIDITTLQFPKGPWSILMTCSLLLWFYDPQLHHFWFTLLASCLATAGSWF